MKQKILNESIILLMSSVTEEENDINVINV